MKLFFFSSRRRHTRFDCDWSSDVCSSDLAAAIGAGRERYVTRGVATTDMTVSRAEGATIWDADGREYLDFAGGIACQNLGHNPESVVQAVHEQVDRYLHQCFMVGLYEPYVE